MTYKKILDVTLPVRVPSANGFLIKQKAPHKSYHFLRSRFESVIHNLTPTDFQVTIRITCCYTDKEWAVDPDNCFVKPLIDAMKGNVIHQDGFLEVREVRLRSIVDGSNWVRIEVFEHGDFSVANQSD